MDDYGLWTKWWWTVSSSFKFSLILVIIDDDVGDHGRCEGVHGAHGDWWLAANQASPGGRASCRAPHTAPSPQSGSDTRKLPQIGIPALKLAHDTTLIVTIPSWKPTN